MDATYSTAMSRVFADEGGYTNDPKDPGGATNWGITIFDARKYWKANATKEDVKAMPKSVAEMIYRERYAKPVRYADLPAGYDYTAIDAAINSGVGRVVPWSAKALGKPVTSIHEVVALANAAPDKVKLIQAFWRVRLTFLKSLKTWSHFGGGWGKRVVNGEAAAVKLWLTFGAAMGPVAVVDVMQTEAKKSASSAKKAGTAAAATGSSGVPLPAIDTAHLGLGGKIAIGIAVAAVVALVIYFINQAIIHKQRAAAYAGA